MRWPAGQVAGPQTTRRRRPPRAGRSRRGRPAGQAATQQRATWQKPFRRYLGGNLVFAQGQLTGGESYKRSRQPRDRRRSAKARAALRGGFVPADGLGLGQRDERPYGARPEKPIGRAAVFTRVFLRSCAAHARYVAGVS